MNVSSTVIFVRTPGGAVPPRFPPERHHPYAFQQHHKHVYCTPSTYGSDKVSVLHASKLTFDTKNMQLCTSNDTSTRIKMQK